ncbi:MAG: glyoxalase/bleomycin resistance/dioxygenase family protein [Rhodospirillaceae bacterium]|nr:glyoxalase/bleomycin resistance/dioxygenase family protein [Rhodospirillaceae bacterium]
MVKPDYARLRLDEPSINFSISQSNGVVGMDHMGIDVDSAEELAEVTERLQAAGHATSPEKDAPCCYAQSKRSWSADPAGVPWETFFSYSTFVTYGTDVAGNAAIAASAGKEGREVSTTAREACC